MKKRDLDLLFQEAKKVIQHSYSPYSGCRVSAAVLTEDSEIYSGTNIENASYGATVCAERVALWKAKSEGAKRLTHILILVDQKQPWAPCGMCRQVMVELMDPKAKVTMGTLKKVGKTVTLKSLVPLTFSSKELKRK